MIIYVRCSYGGGVMDVPVSNDKCKKGSCQFDISEVVEMIKRDEQSGMIKCRICDQFIDFSGFYVDSDLLEVSNKLKAEHMDAYMELTAGLYETFEVKVNRKNQYFLIDKRTNKRILIKESDMLTEYDLDYPSLQSKQNPQFYENAWVFSHENVDVLKNNKLQSVLYLFFPSLSAPRWKEVQVYLNKNTAQQSYFQQCMSASKMFNPKTGQHSVLASGGLGFPNKKNYETRTFEVPLFTDDPNAQIPHKVDLISHPPMRTPRVFHQLINLCGKVYALGGYMRDKEKDTDIPLKTCERFNSSTNQWEDIPSLSNERFLFAALAHNEKIYVIGGKNMNFVTKKEEENLTIEIFDPHINSWKITKILAQPQQICYFTERPYAFVKDNKTIVIFGGRSEKMFHNKASERSLQSAEIQIDQFKYTLTKDMLPHFGIPFEGFTDSQGIYYNNRFIFGFKRYVKEIFIPSLCKYNPNSNDKFTAEEYKTIKI